MELINFHAWMANRKELTAEQVDSLKDKLIIGKVVNNKRDGTEFNAYSISVEEAKALFGGIKEFSFLLSYKGLVPLPESPVGVDIITNTAGVNVVSTQYAGTGEYYITFDQPIFADLKKVQVNNAVRNAYNTYEIGGFVPEPFAANVLNMWLWNRLDDYSIAVVIAYQYGTNSLTKTPKNLETNSTFLPLTIKLA